MATALYKIKSRNKLLKSIDNLYDVKRLLHIDTNAMLLYSQKPKYNIYTIPKNNGGKRLIEDPKKPLKQILKKWNKHLQAAYYFKRPKAVYGFCINHKNEEERNVINNAKQHLQQPYMLNIDLKDFFHSVTETQIQKVLRKHFNHFDKKLQQQLAALFTFKGRLPMGAPTSPVLSNFAILNLDVKLSQYSKNAALKYTRYADDLTFSSKQKITKLDEEVIRDYILKAGYIVNEQKVKYFGKQAVKKVTGLIVGKTKIHLPPKYLDELEIEIQHYEHTMEVERRYQTGMSYKKLKHFHQELIGKINFAQQVTPNLEIISNFYHRVTQAQATKTFESRSWLDIPYIL